MKTNSPSIEQLAEDLSEQAFEYAFKACQYLSLTNLDPGRSELEEAVEEFQIKYLFPNLEEHEREMLLALRYATRSLCITLKTVDRVPGILPESEITWREHFYMHVKDVVDTVLPKLTPVQQQILQGRLFSIKW
jgi:hypothetical protein